MMDKVKVHGNDITALDASWVDGDMFGFSSTEYGSTKEE
jgi:hypothetical protein